MKKKFTILIILCSFLSFSQNPSAEQIELEKNDISKSWIEALHITENPAYNEVAGYIRSVNIYPDYISVNAEFEIFSNRLYWNVPSDAYILANGAKYKLLELYKSGGAWSSSGDFEKLDIDGSYFDKGSKGDSWYFSFIFEKIPSGIFEIDVVLGGQEAYKGGVFSRTGRWEDIYSNFKNVKINNSETNSYSSNTNLNDSKSAQEYFDKGKSYFDLEQYYNAVSDFDKAIELDPEFRDAYFQRGYCKDELEDYYGAISDYSKAIELDPGSVAYNNRGVAKNNLKDYNGAISDYSKAIELDPDYTKAYYNRGLSKDELKDYYGAISDYNKAIELDPNYTSAYVNRGIAKELINDLNGACLDWKKAADLGHTNAAKWVANLCN